MIKFIVKVILVATVGWGCGVSGGGGVVDGDGGLLMMMVVVVVVGRGTKPNSSQSMQQELLYRISE